MGDEGIGLEAKVLTMWEERIRHFKHHDLVIEKLDSLLERMAKLPCDIHESRREEMSKRIKLLEEKPKEDVRFAYVSMLICAILGGLIASGLVNIAKLVERVLGV